MLEVSESPVIGAMLALLTTDGMMMTGGAGVAVNS